MKTRLFYVIAFILCVQIANAQTFGIKGGVNFANMTISGGGMSLSPKSITGFHIGPVADFQLKDQFHFNTGLLYSTKGFKMDVSGEGESFSGTETFSYLEIPLNLAYLFPINDKSDFFIQAGPYLGYALSGKDKFGSETHDIDFAEDMIKRFDYGVGFGGGVQFGSIVASVNYQLGLANLNDDPDVDATFKNKVFQISLAYMFGKKK
jgi:hypothetical protein